MGDHQIGDKVKHKAEELKGKAKELLGDATGNERLKGEGEAEQVKAKLKRAGDEVQESAEDVKDRAKGWTERDR